MPEGYDLKAMELAKLLSSTFGEHWKVDARPGRELDKWDFRVRASVYGCVSIDPDEQDKPKALDTLTRDIRAAQKTIVRTLMESIDMELSDDELCSVIVKLEHKWGAAYRQALDEQRKLTEQYRKELEELKTIIIKGLCTPSIRVER